MSTDEFGIIVYTRAGLLFEDKASSVTLQTVDGEIGVLTQHCRYTGLLGSGITRAAGRWPPLRENTMARAIPFQPALLCGLL